MSKLDLPFKDTSAEKINEKEKINKELEKETSTLKELPKELDDLGWVLTEDNSLEIHYQWDEDYSLIKKKGYDDKYGVGWLNIADESNKYQVGALHEHKDFLNVNIPARNTHLGNMANLNNIKVEATKQPIVKFLNETINLLNKYKVRDIIDYNHEKLKKLGDLEDTEPEKRYEHEIHEDYSEPVQKQAMELIDSNQVFNTFLDVVSWKHEGNTKTIKLLFLGSFGTFINCPTHINLNDLKGEGKTDANSNVRDGLPDQYIVDLTSFSSKYLYYGSNEDLHPEFNLIFSDDTKLDEDKEDIFKLVADNNRPNKIHKTVINGKKVSFKLPGKYWLSMNKAKDDRNEELHDRLYSIKLSNKKKGSKRG